MKYLLLLAFVSLSTSAFCSNINQISDNIIKVCNKPENAGKYWDVVVEGNGNANVKLKLAELGITGAAKFTKGEWSGVRKTVEDSIDYRDCVKKLSPLFIDKFKTIDNKSTAVKQRHLAGIQWKKENHGVVATLHSCKKDTNSATCKFSLLSKDSDKRVALSSRSVIYDQRGHKFIASYATLANTSMEFVTQYQQLSAEIIKDVETELTIRFKDVDSDASYISKASLLIMINVQNTAFDFRNVKLIL